MAATVPQTSRPRARVDLVELAIPRRHFHPFGLPALWAPPDDACRHEIGDHLPPHHQLLVSFSPEERAIGAPRISAV